MPDDELNVDTSASEVDTDGQGDGAADEPNFDELDADSKLELAFGSLAGEDGEDAEDAKAEDGEGDSTPAQDAPEAEEDAEDVAETDEAKDAKAYRNIIKDFSDDPAAFIRRMINALPDEDRAEFVAQADTKPKTKPTKQNPLGLDPEDMDDGEWTPKSAFETAAGPILAEVKDLPKHVDAKLGEMLPGVNHGNLMAEVALAKVNAALEALGIDLADPDPIELHKALAKGDKTYQQVVRGAMEKSVKASIAAHKQARRARPITPAPESRGGVGRLKAGMSLLEIMGTTRD